MAIEEVRIHTALGGVVGMGNSDSDSFIGLGRPGDGSAAPGRPKDARCRIKREAARFRAFGYQVGVFAAVAVALVALSGCESEPTQRDLNDATPPSLLLTVTASKAVDGGLQTVEFGGDIELNMPGGSVFAQASDDDGVSYVELWMTETRVCGSTKVGPGLAGAPTERVEGEVSDTSAPSSLSAGHDINTQPLRPNCSYTFEVWGKAASAATQPVGVESLVARLHLDT